MNGVRFNPFPGLRPFRMEEKYLFFGREEQTAELLQRLRQTRFLAVVGTSGSGKSSLVQAGLLPELYGGTMLQAGSRWEVVVMRPGGNPLTHLAEALVAADLYDRDREDVALEVRATLSRSGLGLLEAARQSDLKAGANLLVVVDQFEEIFRFRRSEAANMEEASAFVNLLLEASRQGEVPIYIALTMRSDYLGDCSEFPDLAEAVNEGEYLIPRLSREQKRAAIVGPVKVGGGSMAPRLLQKLLNDVGDNPDHLPVLQHALMRTWDAWIRDQTDGEPLDLRHYRAVGEMAEALSRHADEVFEELPDDRHRVVAEKVFKALTERSIDNRGIRRPGTLRRLRAIADTDETTLRAAIDPFRRFGRTFLMPSEEWELSPVTVIDMSHESLMRVWTRLDRWVEEESQSARIYRRLADTAALYGAGKSALYHGPDLQIAEGWRRDEHPNEAWANQYGGRFAESMVFLDESARASMAAEEAAETVRRRELEQARALAEVQRQRVAEQVVAGRSLKRLLAIAATVAILAGVASVFAVYQRGRARKSEQAAQTSEQAAQGLASQLKVQLVRGDLGVADEKLRGGEASIGLAHLARAMRTDPTVSAAGFRALSLLAGGALPTQRFPDIAHDKPIGTFLYNPENDLLFTSSEEGREAGLWDLRTGERRFSFHGAYAVVPMVGSGGLPAPALPPGGVPRWVDEELRDARWILHHADDPANPGLDPRYYRKVVPLEDYGEIVRAEIFLRVDDEFTLTVGGAVVGEGKRWDYFHYADLSARLDGKGSLLLEVEARNNLATAGIVGALRLTDRDGKRHLVTTDATWQSSDRRDGSFADTQVLGGPTEWFEGEGRMAVVAPRWSHDRKRLVFLTLPQWSFRALDVETLELAETGVDASGLKGTPVNEIDEDISAFGGQGDVVAFTNRSGAVEMWNLTTGRAVAQPLRGLGSILNWRFTPDGRRLAAIGSDLAIYLWSTVDGSLVRKIVAPDHPAGGNPGLGGFLISPDGEYLFALDSSGTLMNVWNIAEPEAEEPSDWLELPEGFAGVQEIRFIADEALVAVIGLRSAGEENHVFARTFDLKTREVRADIDCGKVVPGFALMTQWSAGSKSHRLSMDSAVGGLTFQLRDAASDGGFGLVGVVSDRQLAVWDLRGGEEIARFTAPEPLYSVGLAPDGRTLIAGSVVRGASAPAMSGSRTAEVGAKKLYVYDLFTTRPEAIPAPILLSGNTDLQFSPDGATMVTMVIGADRAQFWDVQTGRLVRNPVPGKNIGHCFFSDKGDRVAFFQGESTSRGDRSIGLNLGRFTLHQTALPPAISESLTESGAWPSVRGVPGAREWLTFDRPGKGGLGRVRTWDAQTNTVIRSVEVAIDERSPNFAVDWSADGSRLVYKKSENLDAVILEVATGSPLGAIAMGNALFVAGMSGNGKVVALGDAGGGGKIWREGGDPLAFHPFGGRDPIETVRLNEDGSLVAVGNTNNRAFAIVDTATGKAVYGPETLPNPLVDALFLPDGRRVVVSATDYTVLVIDITSGETVQRIPVDEWSRDLALSPDGRTLAIGSSGRVYLWNLEVGAMVAAPFNLPGSATAHRLRFSDDGTLLGVGTSASLGTGDAGVFQIVEVATGTALNEPLTRRADVVSLAFQGDASAVAVGWHDGVIQTLPLPTFGRVPAWLPDLVESIAGARLGPKTGILEPVEEAGLVDARGKFGGSEELEPDGWATWARWLFEDPATRGISPGAQTTVAEYVGRLRESGTTADLLEAVRMTPNDALAAAWLAVRLGEEWQSQGPWSFEFWKETVVRWSDRALHLEPENGEVWALRAEMLQRIGRPAQAEVAARRARELVESGATPASPNIDYALALALVANGEAAAADAAFAEALAQLGARGGTSAAGRGPLPAVLARLKSATGGLTGPRREVRLPDPIPGTYEDFEGVSEGSLPAGWSVRNASDASGSAGLWNLNDPQSDAFKDWVVVSRDRFDRFVAVGGPSALPKLADPPNHFLNGKSARLLSGNFLLALSEGRRGVQIQYLFTPDFNCTGHQGVHVAFHSVYTQNNDATAAMEFSTDGGSTWQPVVYRLAEGDVLKTPDGGVDAVGTFTEMRRQTPRHRDAEGRIRGVRHGDFIGAEVTPELASRIESGTDDDHRQFRRIEVFRLEGADGESRVRFRMVLAGSNSWHWMLDDFGLYSIPGGEPVLEDEDASPKGTEIAAVPGSDQLLEIAEELLKSPSTPSSLAAVLLARRAAGDSPGESRALDLQARALSAAAAGHSSRTAGVTGDHGLSQALACARQAIAAHPEIGAYWQTLARIYLQMGRRKLAEDLRDEATLYFETADALVGWLGKRGTDLQQEIGAALVGVGRMDVPRILLPERQGVVSLWKFLDDGSDQGDAWKLPDFDDRGWRVGAAPLGYGDDGEVTKVAAGPGDAKFVTTYFRTEFTVPDAGAISGLQLQLLRDDGAVVYLNGEEIARDNLPTGAIRFDTLATATVADDKQGDDKEGTFVPILASSGALRSGRNVVAAEVHQVSRTSTDLAFNLQVNGVGLAAAKLPPASELDRLEAALEIPADLRLLLWTARARLLQDAGLVERAGEAREHALAIQPDNPTAWWLEARAAAGAGDSEAAYAAYRKAAEGALALATPSADSRRLFLPLGLWDFASLASRAPASLALAGLRRSKAADADRTWELRQLDRWLEETAPGDSAVMRKRVAFLTTAGEFARAGTLLEALERESPSDVGLDAVGIRERRELLALRENLLRATGRVDEAETVKQAILAAPPRAPGLDARLLDLTPYYNASLYDGRGWEAPGLNLGALPEAFQGHDGIDFDLRGIVQLGGTSKAVSSYPRRVEGIPIEAKAAAVHFLLAACWGGDTKPGSESGAVVFHYADGSSARLPLIDQETISDYWIYDRHTIDPRRIAWTAPNAGSRTEPFQLIHAVWTNPHPERTIASIDLESAMRPEAPFFIAITLE